MGKAGPSWDHFINPEGGDDDLDIYSPLNSSSSSSEEDVSDTEIVMTQILGCLSMNQCLRD